jgi:hypothetical protein
MIAFDDARKIAANFINEGHPREGGYVWVIVDSATIEREYGWIFCYETKQALEGDFRATLLGNVPIVVDRVDGTVRLLATTSALSLEQGIEEYERLRAARGGVRFGLLLRFARFLRRK